MATLGSLAVGSSVYFEVSGIRTEFIIVHQGLPSVDYDSSCDGAWLLMKDVYVVDKYHTSSSNGSNYATSYVHSYLNNDFVNLIDANVIAGIKQVKIPYIKWGGSTSSSTVETGTNGLSTKFFLLATKEAGGTATGTANSVGVALQYFDGGSDSKRIAYLNGTATAWWTRSYYESNRVYYVDTEGSLSRLLVNMTRGFRPACVLDPSLTVDSSGNIKVGSVVKGLATIGGTSKELCGGHANIGGIWKEITKSYYNIGGVWKE